MREMKKRMGSGGTPGNRLDQVEEKVRTVVTVVRRLGVVLGRAHDICERDLLSSGFHETAAALRDELKPLIDALVHFDASSSEGEDTDGL